MNLEVSQEINPLECVNLLANLSQLNSLAILDKRFISNQDSLTATFRRRFEENLFTGRFSVR